MRRTAKVGGFDFTTITKVLLYPSALSSEISITDHYDCAIGSSGPPLLESIDKLEVEKIEMRFGNTIFDNEYP
jgi:hypothetical protein